MLDVYKNKCTKLYGRFTLFPLSTCSLCIRCNTNTNENCAYSINKMSWIFKIFKNLIFGRGKFL